MTQLSSFAPEEVELIVSLPYKAGVWISYADDEEGESDDVREMKALEGCIRAIAKLHEDKPLMSEIAQETLRLKDRWEAWQAGAVNLLPACEKAIGVLKSTATKEEVKNYRAMVTEIATTVAQAYGEFNSFDEEEENGGIFGGLVNRIVAGFSALSEDDSGHPMNVSAAEDSALARLSAALKGE